MSSFKVFTIFCLGFASITSAQANLESRLATKPLEVKSDQNDECASKELRMLRKEWHSSSDEERQVDIDSLKSIDAVVLNPTTQSGHLTGNDYALDYRECEWVGAGRERHESCQYFTKPIGKKLTLNGSSPRVKLERTRGQTLEISSEALRDDHVTIHYQASSRFLYNHINDIDSADFAAALQSSKIYRQSSDHHGDTVCSKTSLKDLSAAMATTVNQ